MSTSKIFQNEFDQALHQRLLMADAVDPQEVDRYDNAMFVLPLTDSSQKEIHESDPQSPDFDAAATQRTLIETNHGHYWVSGNSILSACPDCQAPMTIRSWLRLADCWRCGTSTQLSKEQVDDLLEQVAATESVAATVPEPATSPIAAPSTTVDNVPELAPSMAADAPDQEWNKLTERSLTARLLRRGLSAVPAWLTSFLLHLLLILLLALFVFSSTDQPPTITLSSFISPDVREGGEIRMENPEHELADDLLMANDLEVDQEEIRDVIQKAQETAEELTQDEAPLANLPDLDEVKKNVSTSRDQLMSFAARDPRVRAELIQREGGTSLTEAAVARGLRWLASVQNQDGSWSLGNYSRSHRPNNQGDAAGTSLALLPFLGAGQTHEFGIYKQTVAKGLNWLIQNQEADGDLRANFSGQAGMYAQGQATIVLCEALAMTGDQRFRDPAQRAITFIEKAQHRAGGWRYRPGQIGDTSVLGWQLMALQSARSGDLGIAIDDSTFKLADYFLDQTTYRRNHRTGSMRNMPTGSLYTYRPKEGPATATMTAEAILCRMYLGWQRDDPRLIEAIRWLIENHLPSADEKNVYYWYYATQVMHHYGGDVWKLWNRRMRELLVAGQEKSGSRAGSWDPDDYEWGEHGGRIYVTSLSVCTLEVYYRHLPIFKQIDLRQRSPVSTSR